MKTRFFTPMVLLVFAGSRGKTGMTVGAVSGGVVMGAMWALAGDAVRDIGMAGGSLLSQWMGSGTAVDPDPYVAFRWGGLGSMVGLVVGAAVGAVFGTKATGKSAWATSAAASLAGISVSAAVVQFTEGFGALVDLAIAPVLTVIAGLWVLGILTGVLSGVLLGGLARRASSD